MSQALALAALLFGLIPTPYKATTTKVYGEGGWALQVQSDSFTHQAKCSLTNRHLGRPSMSVAGQALVVHFGSDVDTSFAWLQIDEQSPRPWSDTISSLIASGSLTEAERLDNATSGTLRIPLENLGTASVIRVQPRPHTRPAAISLGSFHAIYASAEALHCAFPLTEEP